MELKKVVGCRGFHPLCPVTRTSFWAEPTSSHTKLSKYADDTAWYMGTYVVWHLQDREHKEDVFLSVLQLLVFKLSVELPVSQREVFAQLFEVGGDVRFGFRLPLEAEASARSVYLLQQLQWEEQPVDNTQGQIPARCHGSQISWSWFLSFFPVFDCDAERADCKKRKITEKINDLFHLFFLRRRRLGN